jgi:probable addiction module antidote protein
MTDKLTAFDAADYLRDEESIAEYLNALMEEEDEDLLLSGIGDIAKARGMTRIAEKAGLGRESLYKALAPGAKPRFETIMRVLHSLGVDLAAVARKAAL